MFDFRYNNRKMPDSDRTVLALRAAEGKRLTLREPKRASGLATVVVLRVESFHVKLICQEVFHTRSLAHDVSCPTLISLHVGRPYFMSHLPDGTHSNFFGKERTRGLVSALWELAHNYIAPPKPEHTVYTEVPSEDVRLLTREGTAFAVLGLSDHGEPTIAVLRHNGSLLEEMTLSEEVEFAAGKPKEWPNLTLFDDYGRTLLTVEFGPGVNPSLHIFEKTDPNSADLGIYTLDSTSSKEIPVANPFSQTEGAIKWLRQRVAPAPAPLSLVDERGATLWRYQPPTQ
jgi:hypothetical protein